MFTAGRVLPQSAALKCGAIAGPLFMGAFTAIGAARPGYDWRRSPVSSLADGRQGWPQRANFILAGLLYVFAALGLRRGPRRRVGPRAVPVLVTGVGIGLAGSGVFVTDLVGDSAPPEQEILATPATLGGVLHNLFAVPIFAGIPVAALASAVSGLRSGDRRWAGCCVGSSAGVVVSFVLFGSASAPSSRLADKGGVFQRISIAAGFGWLTALFVRADRGR